MRCALLEKYGLSHLNVTHISQQFWCERQVELSLSFPREDTVGTVNGKEIHRDFLLELVQETEVEAETREDAVFVLMLNIRNGLEPLKNQLEAAGVVFEDVSVEHLARSVFEAFRGLPTLSDFLIVRYIHQATGDHIGDKAILYDAKFLAHKLAHAGKFWEGQRKAVRAGFREKWKCNYCEYKEGLCMANAEVK